MYALGNKLCNRKSGRRVFTVNPWRRGMIHIGAVNLWRRGTIRTGATNVYRRSKVFQPELLKEQRPHFNASNKGNRRTIVGHNQSVARACWIDHKNKCENTSWLCAALCTVHGRRSGRHPMTYCAMCKFRGLSCALIKGKTRPVAATNID